MNKTDCKDIIRIQRTVSGLNLLDSSGIGSTKRGFERYLYRVYELVRTQKANKSLWKCFHPWNYFQKTKIFIFINVFHVTFSRLLSCAPLQCSKTRKSGTKIVWNNNGHGLLSILISFEGLNYSFFNFKVSNSFPTNGSRLWPIEIEKVKAS